MLLWKINWDNLGGAKRRASLVAQVVSNLPAMQETQVQSLNQKDPLEKEIATHSSILAWRIPWTEGPGRLQSMGSQRVRHDWVTNTLERRQEVPALNVPCQPPQSSQSGIHLGWEMCLPPGRALSQTRYEQEDWPETTRKLTPSPYNLRAQVMWLSSSLGFSPCCCPPRCPFPKKSFAVSISETLGQFLSNC